MLKGALAVSLATRQALDRRVVSSIIVPCLVEVQIARLVFIFIDFFVDESLDFVLLEEVVAMNLDLVGQIHGVLLDPWGDFQSGCDPALIVSDHNCVISFMLVRLVVFIHQQVGRSVVLKATVVLLRVAAGVADCGHVLVERKTVLKACLVLVHVNRHVFLNWFLAEVRNHQAHFEILLGPHARGIVKFLFEGKLAFEGYKPNGYVGVDRFLLQETRSV